MGIAVKATQMGYYGHRRIREGEAFTIETEEQFSKKWMERVGSSDAPVPSAPAVENETPALQVRSGLTELTEEEAAAFKKAAAIKKGTETKKANAAKKAAAQG